MWFDTHCHLDYRGFQADLANIVAEAAAAGVTQMVIPGIAPQGWERMLEIARTYPGTFAACGVHPMNAHLGDEASLSLLSEISPHCVAIGEIGLDYLVDLPRELQQKVFRAQLRVAAAAGLPVLIHCRKAFADLFAILREEGIEKIGGVMHAFSGSPEMVPEAVKLGLYISVSGTVTFPNAVRPLAVARAVPAERLLLETDAPDIPPEPHRGEVNYPSFMVHTAARVAELRGVSLEELARVTMENACRLFRIPATSPLP